MKARRGGGYKSQLEKTLAKGSKTRPYPEPLPHMTPAGKRAWRQVARAMPPEWWEEGDLALLEQYAEAVAMFREAMKDIKRRGCLIDVERRSRSGEVILDRKANPAVTVVAQAVAQCRVLAIRLGLGPASRVSRAKTAMASQAAMKGRLTAPDMIPDAEDLLYAGPKGSA